jgi:hypothetical protein
VLTIPESVLTIPESVLTIPESALTLPRNPCSPWSGAVTGAERLAGE